MVRRFRCPMAACPARIFAERLDTDIACAHRAGIPGILVTTGVTSREGGLAAVGEEMPDAIFDSLPEQRSMAVPSTAFRADYVRRKFEVLLRELDVQETLALVNTNVRREPAAPPVRMASSL